MSILFIGKPSITIVSSIESDEYFYVNCKLDVFHCTSSIEAQVFNRSSAFPAKYSASDIANRLPYSSSLLSRWDPEDLQPYHCFLEIIASTGSTLFSLLSKLPIHVVFACYSSPHHIWNNVAELCCQDLLLRVLHLYPFLETDIGIVLEGSNQHVSCSQNSFPESHIWTSHVNTRLSLYLDRVSQKSYSSETLNCLARKNLSISNAFMRSWIKLTSSKLRSALRGAKVYHPLAFINQSDSSVFGIPSLLVRLFYEQRRALDFYARNILSQAYISPESASPSFLVCAHFQPEASTAPQGGSFCDHISVISALRTAYPASQIFYKEHPGSFAYVLPDSTPTYVATARNVFYYKTLLRHGVHFLDPFVNAAHMISDFSSLIPVTITGSIGIESPLSGLSPVLYFGNPYWEGYPGSIKADTTCLPASVDEVSRLRRSEEWLATKCKSWLHEKAIHHAVPNIPGYGVSPKEMHFSPELNITFSRRLSQALSV